MRVTDYINGQIEAGVFHHDDTQIRAAQQLDALAVALRRHDRINYKKLKQILGIRFLGFRAACPPQGLYLWGGVGRGKSMLMDVFFESLPHKKKLRVHFNAFMQDMHKQIAAWREMSPRQRRASPYFVRGGGADPIIPLAKSIANKAHVLCFDELVVTDITDAMLLSRLFGALWQHGITVVATSNRAPDDLYKDGLNRKLFLPFIAMMKRKCKIFNFDGDTDHRLRHLSQAPVYYHPLNSTSQDSINKTWHRLCSTHKANLTKLHVQGRVFEMMSTQGAARADFHYLCGQALGVADYLEITRLFSTLILENIPQMNAESRNEARRFMLLVDTLYESKTKLIASAQTTADKLYMAGDGAFEFQRTASRLIEMQSHDYLAAERTVPSFICSPKPH